MSVYKPILAAVFLLAIAQNSMADVYKCKNPAGATVFQDKHCAENTSEQVIAKPQPKLCYSVTNSEGQTFEVQNFWTEKQNGNSLFYVQIDQKKTAFALEQLESIKVIGKKNNCALAKLVNKARDSFETAICDDIQYVSDKGENFLALGRLDSIKSCQSRIYADGFWTMEQKKYPIQSAYVSYSKHSKQLKVIVFPFSLSKDEEESMLNQHTIDAVLSKKSDRFAFGITLQLKEELAAPQSSDVIQFQSLWIDNKTMRVRSYDRNWQSALTIKKLEISKSEQGRTAQISWSLTDRNAKEQAEVNVYAIVVEEN